MQPKAFWMRSTFSQSRKINKYAVVIAYVKTPIVQFLDGDYPPLETVI